MQVVSTSTEISQDWHKAAVWEAELYKDIILNQMGEWFIAELLDGRMTGPGHGSNIEPGVIEQLGHMVIIRHKEGDNIDHIKSTIIVFKHGWRA